MKHDKNLLKATQLIRFRAFLEASGFEVRDGKGQFEVLQVKTGPATWAVINQNAAGALASHPDLRSLINHFQSGKAGLPVPFVAAKVADGTKTPDRFIEDLRDDFAMHALQGMLSNTSVCSTVANMTPSLAARDAYRFADAMLEARKHERP